MSKIVLSHLYDELASGWELDLAAPKTSIIGTFVFGVERQENHLFFSPITRSIIKVPLPPAPYVIGRS